MWFLVYALLLLSAPAYAQQTTYCNPMNIDYGYTPIPNFSEWGRHRATADPVIVPFKGDYYLFSTNQWGYWWSPDLAKWNFVPRRFLRPEHKVYDELCAPAVWVQGDSLCVIGSTHEKTFPIWVSTSPRTDTWSEAVDSFEVGAWDPAFLADDDGRLYCYWGSSNLYPLYGIEIDRTTFRPIGTRKELMYLQPERYGWHRFGEYLDNTFLDPFTEGAWVTKHGGKYYLQYGAPGTEFSGYADGVAVSDSPLGPFEQQDHNPFSWKPGGFARGAGHGATFLDKANNYWHISTTVVGVKNNFERRLSFWPAGFDADGTMYTHTAFGDYPHYLPSGTTDHLKSRFTGWMLLNYGKPVRVSSTLGGYLPSFAVDEDIRTYWSAKSGGPSEWIETDLGAAGTVRAVQLNFADQDAVTLGKAPHRGHAHRYRLKYSLDGKTWKMLTDKSSNTEDVPHDYIELKTPVTARYLRLENIAMPEGKFALSGLRVFGLGRGPKPAPVEGFVVLRTEKDRRSAWLKWKPVDGAYAYNIYTGIAPGKLYNCITVHSTNQYYFKSMDRERDYYFAVEAISENGVGPRTAVDGPR